MTTLAERLSAALTGPPERKPADLARACGVKAPSVSDWLSGKTKKMEGSNLLAAAEFLGVNYWWLAAGKGPMRPTGDDRGNNRNQNDDPPDEQKPRWPFRRLSESDVQNLSDAERSQVEGALALAIAQLQLNVRVDAPHQRLNRAITSDEVDLPFPMAPVSPQPWEPGYRREPAAASAHMVQEPAAQYDIGHLGNAGYSANDQEFLAVPELDVRLAAGKLGIENYSETEIGEILLRRSLLESFRLPIDRMKIVYGDGDSMEPIIRHRAPMLFFEDPVTDFRQINPRTVYAINRGGKMIVKCIARTAGGVWVARSLNPAHPDFALETDDGGEVRIVGRILWSPYDLRNGVDERLVRR